MRRGHLPAHRAQGTYNTRTESISMRNSELHRITEQLSEMKGVMDEHSTNISDATPVVSVGWAWRRAAAC